MDRLCIEQCSHAGTENGNLPCTYEDFEAYGVASGAISTAIKDAIKRGLIYQTQRGIASASKQGRAPGRYGLGWLPSADGAEAPNLWKAYGQQPKQPPARHAVPAPAAVAAVPAQPFEVRRGSNGRVQTQMLVPVPLIDGAGTKIEQLARAEHERWTTKLEGAVAEVERVREKEKAE